MSELVPIEPAPGGQLVRRDDTVTARTAERIAQGVPRNTERAYRVVFERFLRWCRDVGREPLPTSPGTLADYVTHLCDAGYAPSTVRQAMSVISARNQLAGHPPLVKAAAKPALLALRGYQREAAEAGRRVQEALPVTVDLLKRMVAACDPATVTGKRDRLLLVLGYALAGRRSELAALRIEDVQPDGSGGLDVLIRASKTDKDSVGEAVNVPAGDHVDTDPVGLLAAWLGALAEQGQDPHRGPLLRAVTQHDRLYRHGSLSPDAVHAIVRRTAKKAGLPNWHRYSGHSLRAGFATESASRGIPVSVWAEHGRWLKTSPVPLKYVRQADKKANNPLKRMGL